MGIQVIVFDCGGVLLRDSEQSDTYHRWEERLELPKDELAQRLYGGTTWQKAELGQITEEEVWPQACADLGLTDETQIEALRQDLWDSWQLDSQILALVDRARQKHRVAILSNATTALVNSALQQITYANSGDAPPGSVQVDFTVDDGNAGGQGSGSKL